MSSGESRESSPGPGRASRIDEVFANLRSTGRIGVMTHIVYGYPSEEASRQIIDLMARAGVDLIEVQLPFSDPTADGPTITHACQKSLDRGVRVAEGVQFVDEVSSAYPNLPFVFMSYLNVAFSYRADASSERGVPAFARATATAGAAGLIIPDMPPEESAEGYPQACRENGLHPIYVLSPNISERRIRAVSELASGFVYCTSRTGTTGKDVELDLDELARFLEPVREIVNLPVAVGFSISSREQIESLRGIADVAVVGSHLIRVYDELGLSGLERELFTLTGN